MSSIHYTLSHEAYPKMEELNPGLKPLEFNVLVLVRKVAERQGSVFIPRGAMEREEEGGDEGLLVAKAARAFEELGESPEVGARVTFARYAGKTYMGADGRMYRIMKDKDVTGERVAEANSAKAAA